MHGIYTVQPNLLKFYFLPKFPDFQSSKFKVQIKKTRISRTSISQNSIYFLWIDEWKGPCWSRIENTVVFVLPLQKIRGIRDSIKNHRDFLQLGMRSTHCISESVSTEAGTFSRQPLKNLSFKMSTDVLALSAITLFWGKSVCTRFKLISTTLAVSKHILLGRSLFSDMNGSKCQLLMRSSSVFGERNGTEDTSWRNSDVRKTLAEMETGVTHCSCDPRGEASKVAQDHLRCPNMIVGICGGSSDLMEPEIEMKKCWRWDWEWGNVKDGNKIENMTVCIKAPDPWP